MANCKFYDQGEIESDFPLSNCPSCESYGHTEDRSFYFCKLIAYQNPIIEEKEEKRDGVHKCFTD